MKLSKANKTIKAISLAACLALATATALAGCSGDRYSALDFAAQDTSYAVTSQGGSAVSYGNYVYFINGTRGYDDTDGNSNAWPDVVKGGLYRAEYNGSSYIDARDGLKKFAPEIDAESGLEFKFTPGTDYFDEPINVADVTRIAAKTVGTTGYAQGGIFIYDNYVYFASPHNQKNSTGTVETTRTDYFMMSLSGGKPTRLYTSSSGVDTSSSAYAFYKYNNTVYLLVNEGSDIVSISVDTKKARANDPVRFKVGATSVYFPVRDVYYSGISTNTPEDFIYFVRAVGDDDTQTQGTVIEAMRPDGSENFTVSMSGKTETIEAVRDGMLFYRSANTQSNTIIKYTNLHDMLLEKSASYSAEFSEEAQAANGTKRTDISGEFGTVIGDSITATYAFRDDVLSNKVYFIATMSGGTYVYSTDGTVRALCTSSGTPITIKNGYLYYSGSESDFYRVPVWENMEGYGEAQSIAASTTSAGISCDYVDGYFTYFAEVDQWAASYTYFYKVDGLEGAEPHFIGQRSSADIPDEDEIEAAKKGTSE